MYFMQYLMTLIQTQSQHLNFLIQVVAPSEEALLIQFTYLVMS